MPGNTHLDKGRRRYTYDDRKPLHHVKDPVMVAYRRTLSMALGDSDRAIFMATFKQVREAELDGQDTYLLYERFSADRDGSVHLAAYMEAVASTRPAGWAQ